MPTVVGIRFKDSGKTYFFDPNGHDHLEQGDAVIVETVRGPELAKVAYAPREVAQEEIVSELKPVLRRAEAADFERLRLLSQRHEEVLARCAEKVSEHDLPMRLVKAEYSFDGSRLTFYFTAEKRVDFRMLVRDLARTFKTRIELRQIGPRDEAKLLGGIGPCGRLLCCATFLPDYARVSIKMAKDQDLPLNPSKISGVCGRLLCCLSYEHEQYLEIKAELPRKGSWVQTPDGPGEVVAVNVIRETVTVELAGSGIQEEYSPSQIHEATERVAGLARSRNQQGITPPAHSDPDRAEHTSPRELHHVRKQRAQEKADTPETYDALKLLEDGLDEWAEQVDRERSHQGGAAAHRRRRPNEGGPRQPADTPQAPPTPTEPKPPKAELRHRRSSEADASAQKPANQATQRAPDDKAPGPVRRRRRRGKRDPK